VVRPQELAMAEQLVANLAEPFDPAKYTDEYRANLMKVIRAKMKGKKIALPEEAEEPGDAKVLDLMAKLQASLGQGRPAAKRAGKAPARGAAKPAAKPASRRKGATARKRSA
jgi:DNA end-binding protein Ku